jgi:hypothetical protein
MEKLDLSDEEKKNKEFKLNPIWPSPPKKRKSALKALSKIKQAVSDLKRHSGLTPKKRRKKATKNIKKNSPQEVLFPRVNPGEKRKRKLPPEKIKENKIPKLILKRDLEREGRGKFLKIEKMLKTLRLRAP